MTPCWPCTMTRDTWPSRSTDFHRSVTVNLGLPLVRTSVDHGTAFDIAGKGVANPQSMLEGAALGRRPGFRRRTYPVAAPPIYPIGVCPRDCPAPSYSVPTE